MHRCAGTRAARQVAADARGVSDASTAHFRIELSREYARLGSDRVLRDRHTRGELVRLTRGAYIDRRVWDSLKPHEQYSARVVALARAAPSTVFSHESAAAMWGLPLLDHATLDLHSRIAPTTGGRSITGMRRHGLGVEPLPTRIGGVQVTSLALTLADLAGSRELASATVPLDGGLARPNGPSRADIARAIAALGDPRRRVRALRALDFADARSQSPGETFSRVQIHALGFPTPELQVEIRDRHGLAGVVDFAWPKLSIVGEFDWHVKYGREREYDRERPDRDILIEEKRREDRIRRVVRGFARWDWAEARDRGRLSAILEAAGLRR